MELGPVLIQRLHGSWGFVIVPQKSGVCVLASVHSDIFIPCLPLDDALTKTSHSPEATSQLATLLARKPKAIRKLGVRG